MIDGKKVYGAYLFTERGSEGITMGVTNVLYPMGFKYEDPKKPYAMDGFVNSATGTAGSFPSDSIHLFGHARDEVCGEELGIQRVAGGLPVLAGMKSVILMPSLAKKSFSFT